MILEKWLRNVPLVDRIEQALGETEYAERCEISNHALAFFLVQVLDGLTFATATQHLTQSEVAKMEESCE